MSNKVLNLFVAALSALTLGVSSCSKKGELAKGLSHKSLTSGAGDQELTATLAGTGAELFEKKNGLLEMHAASFKSLIRPSFPDTLTFNVPCDPALAPRAWKTSTEGYDLNGFYAYANGAGELEACEPAKTERHLFWGFLYCRASRGVYEIKKYFPRERGDVDSVLKDFRCN